MCIDVYIYTRKISFVIQILREEVWPPTIRKESVLSGLDLKNGPHNEFSDIALDNSRALHLGGPHFCCETKEEKVQQLYLVMPCAHLRGLSLYSWTMCIARIRVCRAVTHLNPRSPNSWAHLRLLKLEIHIVWTSVEDDVTYCHRSKAKRETNISLTYELWVVATLSMYKIYFVKATHDRWQQHFSSIWDRQNLLSVASLPSSLCTCSPTWTVWPMAAS